MPHQFHQLIVQLLMGVSSFNIFLCKTYDLLALALHFYDSTCIRVLMAFEDEINYEKISQINKKERKTSRLTDIDSEFYSALIVHLKKLQKENMKRRIFH